MQRSRARKRTQRCQNQQPACAPPGRLTLPPPLPCPADPCWPLACIRGSAALDWPSAAAGVRHKVAPAFAARAACLACAPRALPPLPSPRLRSLRADFAAQASYCPCMPSACFRYPLYVQRRTAYPLCLPVPTRDRLPSLPYRYLPCNCTCTEKIISLTSVPLPVACLCHKWWLAAGGRALAASGGAVRAGPSRR